MPKKAARRRGVPAPPKMSGKEFREIRVTLGLRQSELGRFLGYSHPSRISEFEIGSRAVPSLLVRLMRAYRDGYRPADFPPPSFDPAEAEAA